MPEVTFDLSNLLERKQLSPAWRTLVVKSVDEKAGTKDPTSTTWPVVFTVDGGSDDGVPINHWFTEKQMGRLAAFIACFLPNGKAEVGKKYELTDTIGRKVEGYCLHDPDSSWNTIKDFRPAKTTGEPAKTA